MVIHRRRFLAGGLSLGALGCGSAVAQSTRLRMVWWGSQERADHTFKALNLYSSKNKTVQVDGQTIGWAGYWTRLATQTAGRNAPDIIQMDYPQIAEYGRRGALLALDDYLGKSLHIEDVDRPSVDSGRVDGKLYGMTLSTAVRAMFVNAAAWEEVGLKPPSNGMTLDEFAERAEKLSKDTKRKRFWGAPDGGGSMGFFENWLLGRGKERFTADGKLAIDESDVAEWFRLWAKMRRSGACVPADVQALDQGTTDTSMLALGKAAVVYSYSHLLPGYQKLSKEKLVPVAYPRASADAKPSHYLRPNIALSVSSTTKAAEDCVKLVDFFLNDIESWKVQGTERGVPVSLTIRKELKPFLNDIDHMILEYNDSLGNLLRQMPPSPPPGTGEVDNLWLHISQRVAFEALTPEDGGKQFVAEARAILSRNRS
ncbi:ABC transporter substrate-binding protein [Bradyrhizobium sp. BR 1432]|uniref:ABC transporter substrate-binding protein n=1 Tax=Bradyrhizobium sp. BR 1432 TaxID=3447966 RepID=UPI003EE78D02